MIMTIIPLRQWKPLPKEKSTFIYEKEKTRKIINKKHQVQDI